MPFVFLFCLLSFLFIDVFAQEKNIEVREQTWLGYFNQTRFTKHSGLWVDLHLRLTNEFVNDKSLAMARFGYTYYLGDARITTGYAYISNNAAQANAPDTKEHRPWQQVQWFEKKKYFTLMQWLRLEQRFRDEVVDNEITGNYDFNYRIRYNMAFTIPLKGRTVEPNSPFLFVNNEVFLNLGKEVKVNYFDQNRAFAGIGYQFKNNLNAQLGYMSVFQQRAAAGEFIRVNAIRLFVFHTLDFRKPEIDN